MQIILLRNLRKEHAAEFGEKSAFLGELSSTFSVPIGFVITPACFSYFIKETNTELKLNKLLQQIDITNKIQLQEIANQIQKEIVLKEMPSELKNTFLEYYNSINIEDDVNLHTFLTADNQPFVAVRNSPILSVKKQKLHLSLINVNGEEQLIKAIQTVWASMFTARSLYYRFHRKIYHFEQSLIVQKYINPQFSGIISSAPKETIEVSYCSGLYKPFSAGCAQPNILIAEKETGKVITQVMQKQRLQENELQKDEEELTTAMQNKLFSILKRIEKHFQAAVEIKFAIKNEEIYVLGVCVK